MSAPDEKPTSLVNPHDLLSQTAHRPWPLSPGRWALSMRWTDLLFAHWPVPQAALSRLLPDGYEVDLFDGTAWIGVVPFRMERVQIRGLPRLLPGTSSFAEMNVRTYVRDPKNGQPGVYFFSLDASSLMAVLGARAWFSLPYFFARMSARAEPGGWITYRSRRLFTWRAADLRVRYRPIPQSAALPPSYPGTIEYFLTERYALLTHRGRKLLRGDIHHLQWTLKPAEAEWDSLNVAKAQSVDLPPTAPLLHFSRQLDVLAWPPRVI